MENYIINIGRQLGSGGHTIGEKLSGQLNIAYYDKELLQIASQESGLGKEFFERADEKTNIHLFGDFVGWFSSSMNQGYFNNYLRNESLFQIQSDVIRQLAERQSCIFVGRCADYILRDHPRCLNIFITARFEDRLQRIIKKEKISSEKAKEVIERTDKQRSGYYNYYSNKVWGMSTSYHLCINSSLLGIDETVAYIRSFAEKSLKLT
jgi:cytidylate kinase